MMVKGNKGNIDGAIDENLVLTDKITKVRQLKENLHNLIIESFTKEEELIEKFFEFERRMQELDE